jgi:DNA helicase-4
MNGINLDNEFRLYLLELLKEKNIPVTRKKNEEPLRFKTMHSSKGLDDDVVVLMNVCNDVIPSIHPSSKLFEVFGRTPNKILDEEKRLFYVAITRAKKKLYILTNDRPSEFISG